MFGFITNLITGGPGTAGFTLDALTAACIFIVIDVLGLLVLLSNSSAKEKLSVLGTPMAILFVGLILGVTARFK